MSNVSDTKLLKEWNDTIQSIQGEDWPIDDKLAELDNLKTVLLENKDNAGKVYKDIARLIITARLKLVKKQEKNNIKDARIKKQKRRSTLESHVKGRLNKLEEYALKRSDDGTFKIRDPEGTLLLPDGSMKVDINQPRFALSKFQQEYWKKVQNQVDNAPPGFKHVVPVRAAKKGGRRKKKTRKKTKKRKRRKSRKRRTKSGRKRRRTRKS